MGRERDNHGRYSETVTPERVLELFTDTEPRTTSEVSEAFDVAQKTAYNKLAVVNRQM